MSVTTIVTTAGSATANAYIDVTYGDQYNADRVPNPGRTAWIAATTDQKTAAILWATKLMDSLWIWDGYVPTKEQVLLWPRNGILKRTEWELFPETEIPREIKDATAEYASQLLVEDRTGDSEVETLGLTSLSVGPVDLTFKNSVYAKIVPDAVVTLIPCEWGHLREQRWSYRRLIRA